MRHFRTAFLAVLLLAAPVMAACAVIPSPAAMGCTQDEANECRVVAAAMLVKAANITIGEQLDRGVVTVAEASRLRGLTRQAESALAAARVALPLENGTTAARIAALDAILLQILREQVIKAGS